MRHTLVAAALLVSWSALLYGQAPPTVQAGVYTDAQAGRGQALYKARCAGCHGPAAEGAQAPPLTGAPFFSKWRMEPLSALFIKIRHTMPPAPSAPLTDAEAVDLVAHILKRGGFRAGTTELPAADAAASRIPWGPPRDGEAPRTAGVPAAFPPVGNLAQHMRGIFFPNSNLIFTVQTRDPGAPTPPPSPTAAPGGFSVADWGTGIYTGWQVVENAAVALADVSPLMLTPGLRCENGRLAPVTEADWIRFTEDMVAIAKRTYRLAQTRNQEAVAEATGDLSDACFACHATYRDVGPRGQAPGNPAANAARCTHR